MRMEDLIYGFMETKGLSKTQFCRLCKISSLTFEKLCKGNFTIKLGTARRIAHLLEVSLERMVQCTNHAREDKDSKRGVGAAG